MDEELSRVAVALEFDTEVSVEGLFVEVELLLGRLCERDASDECVPTLPVMSLETVVDQFPELVDDVSGENVSLFDFASAESDFDSEEEGSAESEGILRDDDGDRALRELETSLLTLSEKEFVADALQE